MLLKRNEIAKFSSYISIPIQSGVRAQKKFWPTQFHSCKVFHALIDFITRFLTLLIFFFFYIQRPYLKRKDLASFFYLCLAPYKYYTIE